MSICFPLSHGIFYCCHTLPRMKDSMAWCAFISTSCCLGFPRPPAVRKQLPLAACPKDEGVYIQLQLVFSLPAARAVAVRSTQWHCAVTEWHLWCFVPSWVSVLPLSSGVTSLMNCAWLAWPPRQCCIQRDPCLGDRQDWRAASSQPHQLLSEPRSELGWPLCLAGIWTAEEQHHLWCSAGAASWNGWVLCPSSNSSH